MSRYLLKAVVLKVATIALLLMTTRSAQALVVPASLNPGDSYQLAFVTQGTQTANLGGGIATFNAFVQSQAALNPSLTGAGLGVDWFVIGSTLTVDARDNALVSAPVYLLDGSTIIANDFADMWDGSIANPIDIDQFGTIVATALVHTGSISDGTNAGINSLGTAQNGNVGQTDLTNAAWISNGADQTNISRPYYALSALITVPVPEPMTGGLLAAGMLALLWCRRRN